jgi:hypothetical protein
MRIRFCLAWCWRSLDTFSDSREGRTRRGYGVVHARAAASFTVRLRSLRLCGSISRRRSRLSRCSFNSSNFAGARAVLQRASLRLASSCTSAGCRPRRRFGFTIDLCVINGKSRDKKTRDRCNRGFFRKICSLSMIRPCDHPARLLDGAKWQFASGAGNCRESGL